MTERKVISIPVWALVADCAIGFGFALAFCHWLGNDWKNEVAWYRLLNDVAGLCAAVYLCIRIPHLLLFESDKMRPRKAEHENRRGYGDE